MPPYLGVMRSEAPGWHLHFFRRIFEPDGDRFRLICSGICISYTIYVYIYLCIYLLVYLDIYIYIAYIRTYNCVRVYHNTYIYIYNIDVYIHKPLGLLFHHGLVSSSYAPPISTSFLRSEVQWLQKR